MTNEIDFENRTHEYQEILFDVQLQGVYSNFNIPSTKMYQPIGASNYRAVVNQSNGDVLSIVGKDYKLISHKEAIEMGKQIFTQLYPSVKADELIPYKVVAPFSKASAHIDLIHKDVNYDEWEQEKWIPFLRVSNSYNRTYALSFEVGFVRKLCSNGVLFNKKSMKLKYHHNNKNKIEVESDAKQIEVVFGEFKEQCASLKAINIEPKMMFPLVCKILNVNLVKPKEEELMKKVKKLQNLKELTGSLTEQYFKELGSNGYAAFNLVTDLVSHQDRYKNLIGFYLNVRSFYAKPTDWMEDFLKIVASKNYSLNDYLMNTLASLKKFEDQGLL